jgi:hypothetical protein
LQGIYAFYPKKHKLQERERERLVCYFGWEKEDMDMESKDSGTNCSREMNELGSSREGFGRETIDWVFTSVDEEVHEVEDLLRCPSELGHPALDPNELNLQGEERRGSGARCRRGQLKI